MGDRICVGLFRDGDDESQPNRLPVSADARHCCRPARPGDIHVIPDLRGFLLHKMAALYPHDNAVWGEKRTTISSRSPGWSCSLQDFVMPVFYLFWLVLPFHIPAKSALPWIPHGQLLVHAIIRAVALCLLGLLIQYVRFSHI